MRSSAPRHSASRPAILASHPVAVRCTSSSPRSSGPNQRLSYQTPTRLVSWHRATDGESVNTSKKANRSTHVSVKRVAYYSHSGYIVNTLTRERTYNHYGYT